MTQDESKTPTQESVFDGYVVALGASAGGLEALESFFRHCPSDVDAAFVVIQHLSPDHKSIMKDLLARHTQMEIVVVEQGMQLKANQIFLIPPGMVMTLKGDKFHLSAKSPHVLTLPIDIFFNSMSQCYENRCIAVILSGTGSDGSRGSIAVNAAGGFVAVQDPSEAKFDGMPKSVLSTEIVDVILKAQDLAKRIVNHIANPIPHQVHASSDQVTIPEDDHDAMEGIMDLLLQAGGIDFRDYKSATFVRRIERRIQVRQINSVRDYYILLQEDHTELATLRRELLISVTSFFRDEEAFEALAVNVIPELVAKTDPHSMIRVWSAGTSTGEEAYSLAMLFIEEFERARRWPQLKIFATDVNQQVIEIAAAGQYTQAVAAELSGQRLERFFNKTGNFFTVKPELRQCIVFAKHNLLADPPFTKMDLVSCRNALIYFKPEAQLRAMHRLQYATKRGGVLFLGSSESISGVSKGFEELNPKLKLFRRNSKSLPFVIDGNHHGVSRNVTETQGSKNQLVRSMVNVSRELSSLDQAIGVMLDQYAPPAILVNDSHQAVHFFGHLQPFFRVRSGAVSSQIARMLPEQLVPVAQALLFKAAKDWKELRSDFVSLSCEPDTAKQLVRLTVKPVTIEASERLLLLCFETPNTESTSSEITSTSIDINLETTARIEALQNELAATRESLQATIEELETSNEELQATNEELMASNEELQSSNEELQSVNEELNTVNAEFQEKVMLLNRINVDLDTMAKAVGVATIFVDEQRIITRFSPAAVSIFKLREGDVGRPLDEITHRLKHPSIMADFEQTLASEQTLERELLSDEGKTYLMRIMFYKVPSSSAKGAVATFVDISAFQDAERLQSIIDALPEHIAVLEQDGTIAMVNASWRRFAKANGDPTLLTTGPGANYLEVCRQSLNKEPDQTINKAYQGVKAVLEGSSPVFQLAYPCHAPNEKRWFIMNVGLIKGNHELGAVVSHNNISQWHDENDLIESTE